MFWSNKSLYGTTYEEACFQAFSLHIDVFVLDIMLGSGEYGERLYREIISTGTNGM